MGIRSGIWGVATPMTNKQLQDTDGLAGMSWMMDHARKMAVVSQGITNDTPNGRESRGKSQQYTIDTNGLGWGGR